MDPATGTMIRAGVESIINPLDLYSIECALRLIERYGGKSTAISMGPASAESALREALSMGVDEAALVSHRAFAGSDTWATSYALAQAARTVGNFDLIICGERATDGDTGQVGPGIAAWLDLPVITYVSDIMECAERHIRVKRLVEDGCETLEVDLPCLLTVVKAVADPRLPTLRGKLRAKAARIPVWGPEEIAADSDKLGLPNSPTRVVRIEAAKVAREGKLLVPKSPEELEAAADEIVEYIQRLEIN